MNAAHCILHDVACMCVHVLTCIVIGIRSGIPDNAVRIGGGSSVGRVCVERDYESQSVDCVVCILQRGVGRLCAHLIWGHELQRHR